jgi:hypothetical protein
VPLAGRRPPGGSMIAFSVGVIDTDGLGLSSREMLDNAFRV